MGATLPMTQRPRKPPPTNGTTHGFHQVPSTRQRAPKPEKGVVVLIVLVPGSIPFLGG